MTGPVFVDTNVFVCRHDESAEEKQVRAAQWIEFLAVQRTGRLSYQVLQELYATLTRSRGQVFSRSEAREIVEALFAWQPVQIDQPILRLAWLAHESHQFSWWDSLIVAAAQASRCRILLTEDLQDGQVLDGVRVVDPFGLPDLAPRRVLETID